MTTNPDKEAILHCHRQELLELENALILRAARQNSEAVVQRDRVKEEIERVLARLKDLTDSG